MAKVLRWDIEKLASSRAKREGSSAPTKEELYFYKKYLKQAIKNKKSPRVLVLGATPELRDMAIALGCETLAVDFSWNVIDVMQEIMKFKESEQNLIMKCDWLKISGVVKMSYFDAVLADVSLANLPPHEQLQLLKDSTKLLKQAGYFITREMNYPSEVKDISYFQKQYDEKQITWFKFWFALSLCTAWRDDIYGAKSKQYSVAKYFNLLNPAIKKGKVKFRKEDLWKVNNVEQHGRTVVHYIFPKSKFEGILGRYFFIEKVIKVSPCLYAEFMPIYVLRNKK